MKTNENSFINNFYIVPISGVVITIEETFFFNMYFACGCLFNVKCKSSYSILYVLDANNMKRFYFIRKMQVTFDFKLLSFLQRIL